MSKLTSLQTAALERVEENNGVMPFEFKKSFSQRTFDSLENRDLLKKVTIDLIMTFESVSEAAALEAINLHAYTDAYVSPSKLEEICADAYNFNQTEQAEVVEAETVSYIAQPIDSRCAWWSVQLPADIELSSSKIPAPYLRKGADLELREGDMLVTSEARHHRKNRGYIVALRVCVDASVKTITPTSERKAFIKNNGGTDLMHESGDVAGCVRMAVWLRRQPDLAIAVNQLLTA